jgi:SAM-dependent methyltransferase
VRELALVREPGSNPEAEPTVCPACGGGLDRWMTAAPAEPGRDDRLVLWRCRSCGTAVTGAPAGTRGPAPDSGKLYETGAYAAVAPRLSGLALPLLRAFDRQRLRLVRRALGDGSPAQPPEPALRLLDVGAGRGRFVATARAAGWRADGIEPSHRGVAAARAMGIELRQVRIEDAGVPEGSLDAITAWHVLEHLEHPGPAVARLASWVRPGGVVLIGVPNLSSLQARWSGEHWYHLDLPRHRTHFTPAGLRALVAAHGLTPVHVHHVLLEHNPFGMWQSLVNRVTANPSYLYNLLKRNAPADPRDLTVTGLAVALAPAAVALELGAGLARRGGTIALSARRP